MNKINLYILFACLITQVCFSQQKRNQLDANGQKVGFWVSLDTIKNIETKGNFINGLEEGDCEETNYNTGVISKGKQIKGKLIGTWISYNKEGTIVEKMSFVNGLPDGEFVSFYEDSKIKTKGLYKNGIPQGEWKQFNGYGEITTITKYDLGNDEGSQTNYFDYKNNIIESIGKIKQFKRQGTWKIYKSQENEFDQATNELARKLSEALTNARNKEGNDTLFEKDKPKKNDLEPAKYELTQIFNYNNGLLEGLNKTIKGQNDTLYENFKNDTLNGEFYETSYYSEISQKGNYLNGKLHGEVIIYLCANGKISETVSYKLGIKDGLKKEYYCDSSNSIKYETMFSEDNPIYEKEYFESGKLRKNTDFKTRETEGYYESGKLYEKTNYKGFYRVWFYENGNLQDALSHELKIKYFENGQIQYKWDYTNKIEEEYNESGKLLIKKKLDD